MQLPFTITPHRQFVLSDVRNWVEQHNPTQIEMDDRQYSWFSHLNGMNLKTFEGTPIVFLDGQRTI